MYKRDEITNFIDWDVIHSTSWSDTIDDGERKRRKQPEFLVHKTVPGDCIVSIGVIDKTTKERGEKKYMVIVPDNRG